MIEMPINCAKKIPTKKTAIKTRTAVRRFPRVYAVPDKEAPSRRAAPVSSQS